MGAASHSSDVLARAGIARGGQRGGQSAGAEHHAVHRPSSSPGSRRPSIVPLKEATIVGVRLRELASTERHPGQGTRASEHIDSAESTRHPLARNALLSWEGDAHSNVTFRLPLLSDSSWFRGTGLTLALPSSGVWAGANAGPHCFHFHRVTFQVTSVGQRPPVDRPRIDRSTSDQALTT